MNINNMKALDEFKKKHPDATSFIDAWKAEVDEARWTTPHELKEKYGNASVMGNRNVVFNICGNKYRLWVQISYQFGIVFVKAVGTHKEYDNWKIG
jgi:mRNA interferase HigB